MLPTVPSPSPKVRTPQSNNLSRPSEILESRRKTVTPERCFCGFGLDSLFILLKHRASAGSLFPVTASILPAHSGARDQRFDQGIVLFADREGPGEVPVAIRRFCRITPSISSFVDCGGVSETEKDERTRPRRLITGRIYVGKGFKPLRECRAHKEPSLGSRQRWNTFFRVFSEKDSNIIDYGPHRLDTNNEILRNEKAPAQASAFLSC